MKLNSVKESVKSKVMHRVEDHLDKFFSRILMENIAYNHVGIRPVYSYVHSVSSEMRRARLHTLTGMGWGVKINLRSALDETQTC